MKKPKTPAEPIAANEELDDDGADKRPLKIKKNVPVDPKLLKPREVNARYMEPDMFRRLVENIKMDGDLTADVLVYQRDDGTLELLSGHHRTEAAVAAGLESIDVRVIVSRHNEKRLSAIQLSHNSISGKDDPSKLAQIYEGLDLDWKKYSGLTDDDVSKFKDLKVDAVGAVGIDYEQVTILFLPEDREVFDQALKTLQSGKSLPRIHAARLADFDLFFNATVAIKQRLNIMNSALAVYTMAQLAMERLAQIEEENSGDDEEEGPGPA